MDSTFYVYEPLSSDSSFRLLHLKNLEPSDDALEVELTEENFRDPRPYAAISYVWGRGTADRQITCNGQPFLITSTVLSVLQRVYSENLDAFIWIDSICIDQSSIPERNQQVPKMRLIYRQAQTVWVWLGDGSEETDVTFDYLEKVATIVCLDQSDDPEAKNVTSGHLLAGAEPILDSLENFNLSEKAFDKIKYEFQTFTGKVTKKRGYYDAVDTNFIVDLVNLPWFNRTWTVQEIVLGKRAVVLCGGKLLSWAWFLKTLSTIRKFDSGGQFEWVLAGNSITSNRASYYDDTLCYRQCGRLLQEAKSADLISTALALVRPKSSSDARDKVYALYGIFDYLGIEGLPHVDYGESIQNIYTAIARGAIEHERSLSVLYETCLSPLISDLPSWVPDWSNKTFIEPLPTGRFNASLSSSPAFQFNDAKLELRGIIIDKLADIATSTSCVSENFRRGYKNRFQLSNTDERRAYVIELVRTLQNWIVTSRNRTTYPTTEASSLAFFRTLMLDKDLSVYSSPCKGLRGGSVVETDSFRYRDEGFRFQDVDDLFIIATANLPESKLRLNSILRQVKCRDVVAYITVKEDYQTLFGCSNDFDEWEDELKIRLCLKVWSSKVATLQHEIFLHTYERTFFTTENGYMGLGPRWSRLGDSIALVAGSKVPFIIRETGQHYTLVGPAYVHGIMQGEAWDDSHLEPITLV